MPKHPWTPYALLFLFATGVLITEFLGLVCRGFVEGSCRDFALLEICILMQKGQEFDTGFMISSWNSAWGDVNIPVIDQGYRGLVQSGSIATN